MKNYFSHPAPIYIFLFICLIFGSCSNDESPENTPDKMAPSVSIAIGGLQHSDDAYIVGNIIEINIDAKDDKGIAKVEAFLDGQKAGEDTAPPYQIIIDLSSYIPKSDSTAKYTAMELKVVATDVSGKTTESTSSLQVDNEIPSISEVSLSENTVLKGNGIPVSFSALDDEGISNVSVFLTDHELEVTNDGDGNYRLILDTSNLEDGPKNLIIKASDVAGNLGKYEVRFISDNHGPDISLKDFENNQVLDSLVYLLPNVTDGFSGITNFSLDINGTPIRVQEGAPVEAIPLDPENFPVGEITLNLSATDSLDNETHLTINLIIKRKLFALKMEDGFLESSWYSFWVLVSEMDGSPITSYSAKYGDSEIIFHAPEEFPIDKEYMVSFIADENRSGWVQTHMTIVQNLTRSNFNQIHFTPPYGTGYFHNQFDIEGFNEDAELYARGRNFQFYSNDLNKSLEISQDNGYAQDYPEHVYLIGLNLSEEVPYSYSVLEDPWHPDTIRKTDFTTASVLSGTTTLGPNANGGSLSIYGYETDADYTKDAYNLLFETMDGSLPFNGTIDYFYPNLFKKYKHHVTIYPFNTLREGLPLETYDIPDWNTICQQSGSEILVTNSGSGYSVGRLHLDFGKSEGGSQEFHIIYDSSKTQSIHVPELPEAMSDLSIYEAFQNKAYTLQQADLSGFDNISSYPEYLKKVIAPYKDHTEASGTVDVINAPLSVLGGIYSNWSFKYN